MGTLFLRYLRLALHTKSQYASEMLSPTHILPIWWCHLHGQGQKESARFTVDLPEYF